ncbi:MAG: FlgD immunoglobulin-like domain containing protein [Candidatus Cloacimonetes bacterium]|nr:FlgD immunoglobulin-like domain containing protein [Candidatus Cloacimonadota bacterium]
MAQAYIENFETNTYNYWTSYDIGIKVDEIIGAGGVAGPRGYFDYPTQSMGEWLPDPSVGLWYNIMGDEAGDQGTTTPFTLTNMPIYSCPILPDGTTSYTYPYALTNPADPYYYELKQVNYSQGYWGNFWNSANTSWYVGDINGGYLVSNGMVNLTAAGTLSFSVLKLPAGGGSGYLWVDYATTSDPAGPWTELIDGHQIQHSSGTWVTYTETLPAVTIPETNNMAYIRLRFRGNTTGNNPPFQPQPNYWVDDLTVTNYEPPLPIELSGFLAMLSVDNFVNLTWVTQSETGVLGFYLLRNTQEELDGAVTISELIPATNTSSQQTYVYKDDEISESGTYYYWLQNVDLDGTIQYHGPVSILYSPAGYSIPGIPLATSFDPVYPNPFNPQTNLPFSLAEPGSVSFEIYNSRGQLVRRIETGEKSTGHHQTQWDGLDSSGQPCTTGVYNIRMTIGSSSYSRKAVLLK